MLILYVERPLAAGVSEVQGRSGLPYPNDKPPSAYSSICLISSTADERSYPDGLHGADSLTEIRGPHQKPVTCDETLSSISKWKTSNVVAQYLESAYSVIAP